MSKTYRASDVKKMCETKLLITFRSSGELNGWLVEAEQRLTRVTIPHGRDELKRGTLRSVIQQLGDNRTLFDGLMDCPRKREELVERLRAEA
jgi:hypothetical protein